MFVVTTNPTFIHTVKVTVPVDGGHEDQTFKGQFRVLPTDKESAFDLTTAQGSTDFLKAIVADMSDLVDAQEQPVAYNDKVRDQLLALPFIRSALVKTYYSAIGKAAEGN